MAGAWRSPVLVAGRLRRLSELLALGELALEYSLREERPFLALGRAPVGGTVLGLYEAYRDEHGRPGETYRRITGGPVMEARPGWSYVAAAVPGMGDLGGLAARAFGASTCLRAPVGFTAADRVGYVEAFTPLDEAEALACLAEVLALEPRGRVHVPRASLGELAGLFESEQWRLYRYRRGDAEAEARRGKYWVKLSIALSDVYVSDYWLTGVFYAAPPSEIYTILNTLRGMRLDELTLYNLELAVEKRLQTHGVTKSDLRRLLRQLHRQAGERYYTAQTA